MQLKNIDRESREQMDAAYSEFLTRADKLLGERFSGKLGGIFHFHNDAFQRLEFTATELLDKVA